MAGSAEDRRPRTAIVLVHGVGDPRPGQALSDFTAALAAHDGVQIDLAPAREVRLEDRSRPPADLRRFFPAWCCEGRLDGESVVFAEVFWGDASRVAAGIRGALSGLLSLVFGLDAVIAGNRRESPPTGVDRLATWLGWLGSGCLRGPVSAINLLLLMGTFGILGATALGLSDPQGRWAAPAVGLGALVTGGIGAWILARARRQAAFEGYRPLERYRLFALCCMAGALLWPLLAAYQSQAPETWRQWVALLGPFLLPLFGLAALSVLVVVTLYVATIVRHSRGDPRRRSLAAKTMALVLQFVLWSTIAPALWLVALALPALVDRSGVSRPDPELVQAFHNAAPAQGLQWLLLPVVVVAIAATWWTRRVSARPPRLIVGAGIQVALAGVVVYGVPAAILIGLRAYSSLETPDGTPNALAAFGHWLGAHVLPGIEVVAGWLPVPSMDAIRAVQSAELTVIPTVALLLGTTFLAGGVRVGLDVANDVINYLLYNVAEEKRNFSPEGRTRQERLRPIRGRFNEVLRHLARNEALERLVIIAHSQGTVIALDELAHSNFGRERGWLRSIDVRLVTMGSPAAHLYQHYFPTAYPDWPVAAYWGELWQRLNRWRNVYRLDDFVGTTLGVTADSRFDEVCIGRGGHLNYWRDRRAIQAIVDGGIL